MSLPAEQPRRVAMFLHSWSEGGAQRRTLSLAGALADRGFEVDLLVVRNEGPLKEHVPGNVRVRTVGRFLSLLPRARRKRSRQVRAAILALAWYLRRKRPHVLVSAANHTALATTRAHRLSRCKDVALVLRVSNALISRERTNAEARALDMREALRSVDVVACISRSLANEAESLCSVPRPDIRIMRNPVLDRAAIAAARMPLETPPDPTLLIVGLGRLVPQKDFATLIRAVAMLPEWHRPRVAILGVGPERTSLGALAAELQLGDRVEFPGRVANPFEWLRRARLFVLSSRWEGLPGALIEAMAAGCPVISTDLPGAREVLDGGILAPLVPPGDAAALALAIEQALQGARVDTAPLVARALSYSVEAATDDFVGVIEAAIARRRMSARPA